MSKTDTQMVPAKPLPFQEDTPHPQIREAFFGMMKKIADLENKLKIQKNQNKVKQREVKKLKDELEIKERVIQELRNQDKEEEEESDDDWDYGDIKRLKKENYELNQKVKDLYERLAQAQDKAITAIMMR